MKRFVSVWLPNWPMTRLARAEPRMVPDAEPFALVDLAGPRGIVVTAVNSPAAREGISPGMALTDARAALPSLRVRPGEHSEDARVLFKLGQWAGRYGPSRGHDREDGFWIDITGVAHLYGGEEELMRDLIARLDAFGIPACAALADTYAAAFGLARFAVQKKSAWRIVAPGALRAALAPLPVDALRLDEDCIVLLKRLGLRRIGDLYSIPRISLAHRFASIDAAQRVLERLDQALGRSAEPLIPFFELSPFVVRRTFSEPLISSQPLEGVINELCDELAEALKDKDMGTHALMLRYFRADGTAGVTGTMMRAHSNDGAHFRLLLAPKLEKIDAGFGIDLLSLEATLVGPHKGTQPGFAEEGAAAYDPGPLIDALSNRLGQAAVYMLSPRDSHVPERSQARVPAVPIAGENRTLQTTPKTKQKAARASKDARKNSSISSAYTPPWPYGKDGPRRPPFLLARPEPIDVVAEVPDGPPARFIWRRVERRIARAQGPRRIAPEWWRTIGMSRPARIRDYYEIEDEGGAAYWVFRNGLFGGAQEEGDEEAAPPRWFLHGLFC
ncbi:MAG: hypothetical protein AB7H53_17040 [Hyphomicrobium sp.]